MVESREHVVGIGLVGRREGDRGLQFGIGGFGSGRKERYQGDFVPEAVAT